jgi:hypothetical protein
MSRAPAMKSAREKIPDTDGRVPRKEEGKAGASPDTADYNAFLGSPMDLPAELVECAKASGKTTLGTRFADGAPSQSQST